MDEQGMAVIQETMRTLDLDHFTSNFMRLPNGGTMWMPSGDRMGHYRDWFDYDGLYEAWRQAGDPQEHLALELDDGTQVQLRVLWQGPEPTFLFPHGYLFLDWIKPVVAPDMHLAMVITGTGTSKTSGVACAALTYCVLYPGFHFLNVAPKQYQADLMIGEMDKWGSQTAYREFLVPARGGRLFWSKPHPHLVIKSPLDPKHPSIFMCQTIGGDASNILGSNQDWLNVEEAGLVVGLEAATPKLVTRSRAQRSTGMPRWSKFTVISNPSDNPELGLLRQRIEAIARSPGLGINAMYLGKIDSDINPYTTRSQMAFQESMMDDIDQERWHGGSTEAAIEGREIPVAMIGMCEDESMTEALAGRQWSGQKRDSLGWVHYSQPRQDGHTYIVVGDPGKGAPRRLSTNNVPVVLVLDVTDFLDKPCRLAHYHVIDGDGTYRPWIREFKRCMLRYLAPGYYDSTNMNTALEDVDAFKDGPYVTQPLSFGGSNKIWARTCFQLMCQGQMFAWPRLRRLRYEAEAYRESGVGHQEVADDVLAALFIFCLVLRIEGTLWDRFLEKFRIDERALDPLEEPAPDGDLAIAGLLRGGSRDARSSGLARRSSRR